MRSIPGAHSYATAGGHRRRRFRLGGAGAGQHHEVLRIVHAPAGPRGGHEQGKMCLRVLATDEMMHAPFVIFQPIGCCPIYGPGTGALGMGAQGPGLKFLEGQFYAGYRYGIGYH